MFYFLSKLILQEIIQNLTSEIVENPEHHVWFGVQSPAHKVRLAQRNEGGGVDT